MKIVGCILIFLSSLLCSYYYEKGLKKKSENLEEIICLISFIKNKIEYFSIPINKILLEYNTKNKLIQQLINSRNLDSSNFDKQTENEINTFISTIGNGYKKEEVALCDYNIKLFSQKLSKIKSENPNKIKVFRAISLFVGISIIILLV